LFRSLGFQSVRYAAQRSPVCFDAHLARQPTSALGRLRQQATVASASGAARPCGTIVFLFTRQENVADRISAGNQLAVCGFLGIISTPLTRP
jgi:hypothetical protein